MNTIKRLFTLMSLLAVMTGASATNFVAQIYCEGWATDDASGNKVFDFDANGTLTYTAPGASYVFIRNDDTGEQYCTDGWTNYANPVTLVNQNSLSNPGNFEKFYVPSGEHTLYLVDNGNDTFTIAYDKDIRTRDPKTLPYSYGFEDNDLSVDGWTTLNLSVNNSARFGIKENAKQTGNYGFSFSSYNASSDYNQYLFSPELITPDDFEVSFSYRSSAYTESFKVGYSSTTTDVSSFNWDDVDQINTSSTSWTKFTHTFPAGTKYVAINYVSHYQSDLYVDDFAFGNSGKTVYVYPKSVNTVGEQVVLWSWPLGGEGKWTKGIPDDTYTGCYRFEIPIDHNNCVACIIAETDPIAWDRVEAKSNDLSLPSETDGVLIVFPTFTPETLPVLPTDVTTIDHLSDYVDDEPTNWDAVWAEYAYNGELGNIYSPEQTVFKIWNPLAKKVSLKRYATGTDAETDAKTLGTIEMEQLMDGDRWTGVWTASVDGDINGSYYTYDVDGTEMPDPWSKAVGYDGKRSMVCDLSRTEPDGWENDVHVFYERGNKIESIDVPTFSADPMCGISEQDRGKYLALTVEGTTYENAGEQLTCMSKLKESGTKAIILTITDPQAVPDQYSRNPYDGAIVVNEVKQVVQAVHKDFGMSFFVRFDFSTTPVLEPMTSSYIQEICKYWVWEYHADGIVLAADIDAETKAAIREALDALDTRLILGTEEEIMSGDGLAKDDEGNYLLATAADWKAFAALIETEPTANAKMTEDIDLGDDQTMVGTVEHPYQGNFDGQGHTLTVNLDSYYTFDIGAVAPFSCVKDATIKNLHVAGSLKQQYCSAGGVAGTILGNLTVSQCWVSAYIYVQGYGNYQGTIGGIASYCDDPNVRNCEILIEDCIFSGTLGTGIHSGSMMSHVNGEYGNHATLRNCLNIGTFPGASGSTGTFIRPIQGNAFDIVNCYYRNSFGTTQGIHATDEELANGTTNYALLAYRAEDIWVQSELTNTPMLKIFADEGTYTAIRSVVNRQSPMVNGQYYDLSGRKVKNPGKGIYIYNGKKVMK